MSSAEHRLFFVAIRAANLLLCETAKISMKRNWILPCRPLFGTSDNESRWWFDRDKAATETTLVVGVVIADCTDPANEGEVPLVSADVLFRAPPLCALLLVLIPLLPVVVVAVPLTMHPGFA